MIDGDFPDWRSDPFALLRQGFERDEKEREEKRKKASDQVQITSGAGMHVDQSGREITISKLDA